MIRVDQPPQFRLEYDKLNKAQREDIDDQVDLIELGRIDELNKVEGITLEDGSRGSVLLVRQDLYVIYNVAVVNGDIVYTMLYPGLGRLY